MKNVLKKYIRNNPTMMLSRIFRKPIIQPSCFKTRSENGNLGQCGLKYDQIPIFENT